MPTSIAHHFRCPNCGFDLYSAPLDGNCPECGRAIPKRKGLDKAKNPRRVNSQHRVRIRRAQRGLWSAGPFTLVALIIAGGSLWFLMPKGLVLLAWICVFCGGMWLWSIWMTIARAKEAMVPEENDKPPAPGDA